MPYHRLTREQRYTIETQIRSKTQKEIARDIGVHPSSVSRELKRCGMIRSTYCFARAQKHAEALGSRNGCPVPAETMRLAEEKLRMCQWSPEQISGHIRRDDRIANVSHETLYKHVYRPPIVEERSRIGDWEMDTVIGRPGGPVLVTMVERKSRYTLIGLAASKEAGEVGSAILQSMGTHRDKVLTTTYDNGKEFAHHKLIGELLGASAYFAHPYHSWERGLNENTNGLIRQYFPKGMDFGTLTPEAVREIQDKLNSRPRKCIDYLTPNDIFRPPPTIALAA
jgi:IS30 family transposase